MLIAVDSDERLVAVYRLPDSRCVAFPFDDIWRGYITQGADPPWGTHEQPSNPPVVCWFGGDGDPFPSLAEALRKH